MPLSSNPVLIDYGCHSFSYRLATHLSDSGYPLRYFGNGSLESPNLGSLTSWVDERPWLVRSIRCRYPYGKMSLSRRIRSELEWARNCIDALEEEQPSAVILSCAPLSVATRLLRWLQKRQIPLIYWLQDLQGRAIYNLLGRRIGLPGKVLGTFARLWEQRMLEQSSMVITIADGHELELPPSVRREGRYTLLENWANIEEFPLFSPSNDWAARHGLDRSLNVIYSGTLGLKHDLATFLALASSFSNRPDVRIVVVSSGEAANQLGSQVRAAGLSNLVLLPFQPYEDVPKVLASAAVLIAPLEASAGGFCVPSKVLSYFCAGRPTVIAIDSNNPAAKTIRRIGAGTVIRPGDTRQFVAAVSAFLSSPEKRAFAGRSARAYAEQTFGLPHITQKVLEIFSRSNVPFSRQFTRDDSLQTRSGAAV